MRKTRSKDNYLIKSAEVAVSRMIPRVMAVLRGEVGDTSTSPTGSGVAVWSGWSECKPRGEGDMVSDTSIRNKTFSCDYRCLDSGPIGNSMKEVS